MSRAIAVVVLPAKLCLWLLYSRSFCMPHSYLGMLFTSMMRAEHFIHCTINLNEFLAKRNDPLRGARVSVKTKRKGGKEIGDGKSRNLSLKSADGPAIKLECGARVCARRCRGRFAEHVLRFGSGREPRMHLICLWR